MFFKKAFSVHLIRSISHTYTNTNMLFYKEFRFTYLTSVSLKSVQLQLQLNLHSTFFILTTGVFVPKWWPTIKYPSSTAASLTTYSLLFIVFLHYQAPVEQFDGARDTVHQPSTVTTNPCLFFPNSFLFCCLLCTDSFLERNRLRSNKLK